MRFETKETLEALEAEYRRRVMQFMVAAAKNGAPVERVEMSETETIVNGVKRSATGPWTK